MLGIDSTLRASWRRNAQLVSLGAGKRGCVRNGTRKVNRNHEDISGIFRRRDRTGGANVIPRYSKLEITKLKREKFEEEIYCNG